MASANSLIEKLYLLQEENLMGHRNKLITEAVLQMLNDGEINSKTADYLILENPRTPNFYLLPKFHKKQIPPPGRPIVLANQCPSERISQFGDPFIQPIVTTLPSYLRDSSHLINIVKDLTLPNNAILAH